MEKSRAHTNSFPVCFYVEFNIRLYQYLFEMLQENVGDFSKLRIKGEESSLQTGLQSCRHLERHISEVTS